MKCAPLTPHIGLDGAVPAYAVPGSYMAYKAAGAVGRNGAMHGLSFRRHACERTYLSVSDYSPSLFRVLRCTDFDGLVPG